MGQSEDQGTHGNGDPVLPPGKHGQQLAQDSPAEAHLFGHGDQYADDNVADGLAHHLLK